MANSGIVFCCDTFGFCVALTAQSNCVAANRGGAEHNGCVVDFSWSFAGLVLWE